MPELCRFRGMVFLMFADEGIHNVAHFPVRYAGYKASFSLDGSLLAGDLPRAQRRLVSQWAQLHQSELSDNWQRRLDQKRPNRIDPLA
jgi:hypothetical protein